MIVGYSYHLNKEPQLVPLFAKILKCMKMLRSYSTWCCCFFKFYWIQCTSFFYTQINFFLIDISVIVKIWCFTIVPIALLYFYKDVFQELYQILLRILAILEMAIVSNSCIILYLKSRF